MIDQPKYVAVLLSVTSAHTHVREISICPTYSKHDVYRCGMHVTTHHKHVHKKRTHLCLSHVHADSLSSLVDDVDMHTTNPSDCLNC